MSTSIMRNSDNDNDNYIWDTDIGLTKSIYHDNQYIICMTSGYSNTSISA